MSAIAPPPPRAAPPPKIVAPKLEAISSSKNIENIGGLAFTINAVEGWGKTSMGAFSPKPAILMSRGETGFKTLRKFNRVPDVPGVELNSWNATLNLVTELAASDHQTIVLDAMDGFERLCHEQVCLTEFNGDWGEKGFTGFMRGYETAIPVWLQLLQRLDVCRGAGKNVIFLSHAKARTFKNPLGPDFDRYIADVHEKTWAVTTKWADAVFFGNYVTVTQEKKGRIKGIGGTEHVLFTQRCDGYDAKNRFGMKPQLDLAEDPAAMWPTLWNAIIGKQAEAPADVADPMPEL